MKFEFYTNREREYIPYYSGIDWEFKWLLANNVKDSPTLWFTHEDDEAEITRCEDFQICQENCVIYLNQTDDKFNLITINADEKTVYLFTQHQIGREAFFELVDQIGEEVMIVHTKHPPEHITESIIQIMGEDLEPITSCADIPFEEF